MVQRLLEGRRIREASALLGWASQCVLLMWILFSNYQSQKRKQEALEERHGAPAREAPLPGLLRSLRRWMQHCSSLLISAASLQDFKAFKYKGILEEKGREALTKEWWIRVKDIMSDFIDMIWPILFRLERFDRWTDENVLLLKTPNSIGQ